MNEPKFKIGDRVIVCGELETIIDKVDKIQTEDGDTYYLYSFKDKIGKFYTAVERDLEINNRNQQISGWVTPYLRWKKKLIKNGENTEFKLVLQQWVDLYMSEENNKGEWRDIPIIDEE